MLQTLVAEGYESFANTAMDDRKLAELPPFSFMALVRAEAVDARQAHAFLIQVSEILESNKWVVAFERSYCCNLINDQRLMTACPGYVY